MEARERDRAPHKARPVIYIFVISDPKPLSYCYLNILLFIAHIIDSYLIQSMHLLIQHKKIFYLTHVGWTETAYFAKQMYSRTEKWKVKIP